MIQETVEDSSYKDKIDIDSILFRLEDEVVGEDTINDIVLFTSNLVLVSKGIFKNTTIAKTITEVTRNGTLVTTVYETLKEVKYLLEKKSFINISSILNMLPEDDYLYFNRSNHNDMILVNSNATLVDELNLLISKVGMLNTVRILKIFNSIKKI